MVFSRHRPLSLLFSPAASHLDLAQTLRKLDELMPGRIVPERIVDPRALWEALLSQCATARLPYPC